MPFGLGVVEVLLIVALLLLLFGARRIPLIGRGLGAAIRNFKGEVKGDPQERDRLEEGDERSPEERHRRDV